MFRRSPPSGSYGIFSAIHKTIVTNLRLSLLSGANFPRPFDWLRAGFTEAGCMRVNLCETEFGPEFVIIPCGFNQEC